MFNFLISIISYSSLHKKKAYTQIYPFKNIYYLISGTFQDTNIVDQIVNLNLMISGSIQDYHDLLIVMNSGTV